MPSRIAMSVLLGAAGSIGVLAPVSVSPASGVEAATAECATCCPQANAACVVCGTEKCVVHPGYYEGKTGPGGCDVDQT